MFDRADVVLRYDGSFEGLLCCIFYCFEHKLTPMAITPINCEQVMLFPSKEITLDETKANRVLTGITKKISRDALYLVESSFLCDLKDKELHILNFLRFGFQVGKGAADYLSEPCVDVLQKAVLHLNRESHLFLGFVRFREIGGTLVSQINPKNYVLPVIAQHFIDRYPSESLLIVDRTHNQAFAYSGGRSELFFFDELTLSPSDAQEKQFEDLWKSFYNTIGIKERYNPKCRLTHMPKRYWSNLTEFQEETLEHTPVQRLTD